MASSRWSADDAVCTPPKSKPRYLTVFRAKTVSKESHRIGTPDGVEEGDLLVFFDERRAFVTRYVAKVTSWGCETAPLLEGDKPYMVRFESYYEGLRLISDK